MQNLPLSLNTLADSLLSKGLQAHRDDLIDILRMVGYYRLQGYWLDLRDGNGQLPQVSLDDIKARYNFNHELSAALYTPLSVLEVAIHANVVDAFGKCYPQELSPHLNPKCLDHQHKEFNKRYQEWRTKIVTVQEKSNTAIARRFNDANTDMPLWAAAQLMSFGDILKLAHFNKKIIVQCAEVFGVQKKAFYPFSMVIKELRNKIAHHERIWNVSFNIKKSNIQKMGKWPTSLSTDKSYLFTVIFIMQTMLSTVGRKVDFVGQFTGLFEKYPSIVKDDMGFPPSWAAVLDNFE